MDHRQLAGRFNARFAAAGRDPRTLLVGGAEEPLYLPPAGRRPALIRYTRDYARSALHEMAHWCLADPARRARVDYGLWYQPPPRTATHQARFYDAEVPVQALEMLFCRICGLTFHFSADNPGADGGPARRSFEARVRCRFDELCSRALGGDLDLAAGADAVTVLEAMNRSWRECLPRPRIACGER